MYNIILEVSGGVVLRNAPGGYYEPFTPNTVTDLSGIEEFDSSYNYDSQFKYSLIFTGNNERLSGYLYLMNPRYSDIYELMKHAENDYDNRKKNRRNDIWHDQQSVRANEAIFKFPNSSTTIYQTDSSTNILLAEKNTLDNDMFIHEIYKQIGSSRFPLKDCSMNLVNTDDTNNTLLSIEPLNGPIINFNYSFIVDNIRDLSNDLIISTQDASQNIVPCIQIIYHSTYGYNAFNLQGYFREISNNTTDNNRPSWDDVPYSPTLIHAFVFNGYIPRRNDPSTTTSTEPWPIISNPTDYNIDQAEGWLAGGRHHSTRTATTSTTSPMV